MENQILTKNIEKMKKTILNLFIVLSALFAITQCSSEKEVEKSEEMKAFLEMFDGTSAGVSAALAKYAATDELKEHDMSMYDLKEPKVTAREGDCYTIEVASGITTRVYDICWKEGKITKIEHKELK